MKKAILQIKLFNRHVKLHLGSKYLYAYLSLIYCIIRFGASPDDYFFTEFFNYSNYNRKKFLTWRKSVRLIRKYNDKDHIQKFSNKTLFNSFFSEFIKREWISLNNSTYEQFRNFVKKHTSVLLKPIEGSQGHGIRKIDYSDADLKGVYDGDKNYIVEEILLQHPDMSKLNPSSVNTIRVITFSSGGTVHFISCSLRTGGNNSFVDNLMSNGVCGNIDIDTGIVDRPCVDLEFNKYLFHPDTNEKLVGFQLPLWDKVKDTIVQASLKIPEVKYIGWDVAILENDIALIEGNHNSGRYLGQMIDKVGKWEVIKKYF